MSRQELVHWVAVGGAQVTESQVTRWRKRGLLLKLPKKHLGYGRGTESRYPVLALPQAHALALYLDMDRNLERAGWWIWGLGYPVTPWARKRIVAQIEDWEYRLREGLDAFEAEEDLADSRLATNPIERLLYTRLPRGVASMRRRTGKAGEFTTVLRMGIDALLGDVAQIESRDESDAEIVLRALGATPRRRGNRVRKPEARVRPGASRVLRLFADAATKANLKTLRKTVASSGDLLLETYRDEARAASEILVHLSGVRPLWLPVSLPVLTAWIGLRTLFPALREVMNTLNLNETWTSFRASPLERWLDAHPEMALLWRGVV